MTRRRFFEIMAGALIAIGLFLLIGAEGSVKESGFCSPYSFLGGVALVGVGFVLAAILDSTGKDKEGGR